MWSIRIVNNKIKTTICNEYFYYYNNLKIFLHRRRNYENVEVYPYRKEKHI